MGIYRGAGGSGDAVNDASSEALITIQARDAALAAQAAAEAAQTAAELAETNAETAETNAETAETNAETAATNAAASASAASTSASNAASSASAASTSASNAATSATNASNSASSASTSATNASNSASAAATSASNAATSESNAATSASNAAASYDSFDDRYLGAKSSAPTLDNDGNALLTGALYFNTSTNEMKVWSGSAWLNAYASLSGALLATNNLSDLNNTATARTNLGVAIGTDVQAYDADTAKLDVAQSWSAAQSFNAGVTLGDASGDALTINSSAVSIPNGLNFDSNTFVIDAANNRVGVGVASPTVALDVSGVASAGNIRATTTFQLVDSLSTARNVMELVSDDLRIATGTTAGARSIYFQTENAERMRITDTGNVGIGTASPASVFHVDYDSSGIAPRISGTSLGRLDIEDEGVADSSRPFQYLSSDDGSLIFGNANRSGTGTTSSTERMRITSAGNVGIGTSSPSYKLEVRGELAASNGTYGTILTYSLGNQTGIINTYGNHGLEFRTNNAERMRIDSSGNVGIGTSSPAAKLNVNDTTALSFIINSTNAAGTRMEFRRSGTIYTYFGDAGSIIGSGSTGGTALVTNGANPLLFGTNLTERMRITSGGAVGIGTSSPTANTLTLTGRYFFASDSQSAFGDNGLIGGGAADGNTQIQYYGGKYLTIKEGATERMRITSGGDLQFNSGYGSVATAYGCRAWVNFNGTGTVAINGSGNVSSITDNGTGDYTVNFTNALTDSNYSFTSSIDWGNTAFGASARSTCIVSLATTNARTRTGYLDASATFTAEDEAVICVSIFR